MDDSARVITVGSIAGIQIGNVGDNGTYGYAASKAAVHHLTKHLAVELAPRGILVNAIAPGFFITKVARRRGRNGRQIDDWDGQRILRGLWCGCVLGLPRIVMVLWCRLMGGAHLVGKL
jgi:NAD(P)-dependent dehydrogenase (short-subunit alcohol dehydrogenase family)